MPGGADLDKAIQNAAHEPSDLQKLRKLSDSLLEPELAVHIVENAHTAIIVVRKDGTIFYMNREAEFTFGYARHELFDASVHELVPERLRADHDRMFAQWLESPRIRPFSDALHTIAVTKDGTELPVMIALLPVVIAAGFFVVATIRKKMGNG